MISVLIVEHDPILREALGAQLGARGCKARLAKDPAAAIALIGVEGPRLSGLLASVEPEYANGGWDLARLARERNPRIAIAYLSAEGHGDWAVHGVPNSVLVNRSVTAAGIAETLLRLCIADRGTTGGAGEAALPSIDKARERDTLHAMFRQAPSFIAFLDGPDHRFTFANAAYLRVVERTDIVGRTVIEVFPEVVTQGFVAILDKVYRSGEAFLAQGVELHFDREGGPAKRVFLDFIYHPIRDAAGAVTGIFVEGMDVTERHAAQHQIQTLQNDLIHLARVNAMGTLAATIAHELNQPLASIHNYMAAAAMIARRQAADPKLGLCLEAAGDAALRAGDIVRNLKTMATKGGTVRQPVPIEAAIREAVMLACAGRNDIRIAYDFGTTASVLADRIQIQQVLINLVQNACEATADAPGALRISTVERGPLVEIGVRDAGPGIAPHLLNTIFESFVTTTPDGMGVGLSVCRTIVESHGGTITARNAADGGAAFAFTLMRA